MTSASAATPAPAPMRPTENAEVWTFAKFALWACIVTLVELDTLPSIETSVGASTSAVGTAMLRPPSRPPDARSLWELATSCDVAVKLTPPLLAVDAPVPDSAWTSAVPVTSAKSTAPLPANANPTFSCSVFASAYSEALASTVTLDELLIVPSWRARTAPPSCATANIRPSETAPRPSPSACAIAWLPASRQSCPESVMLFNPSALVCGCLEVSGLSNLAT